MESATNSKAKPKENPGLKPNRIHPYGNELLGSVMKQNSPIVYSLPATV
jgi:hypothetical protein